MIQGTGHAKIARLRILYQPVADAVLMIVTILKMSALIMKQGIRIVIFNYGNQPEFGRIKAKFKSTSFAMIIFEINELTALIATKYFHVLLKMQQQVNTMPSQIILRLIKG